MIVVEQMTGYGDLILSQLKIMGFKRFYSTIRKRADKPPMRSEMVGTAQQALTKPLCSLYRFTEAVENGWYKPKSRQLKSDLRKFSAKELLASGGGHVTAAAQSYVGAHNGLSVGHEQVDQA